MEERLAYLRAQLASAIADFDGSLRVQPEDFPPNVADLIRNGQVQKFEFTIELFWKTAKAFILEVHGFDLASPKPVIKKYFELGYVDYTACDRLIRALEIRNSLSHVYKQVTFLELYTEIARLEGFLAAAAAGMA